MFRTRWEMMMSTESKQRTVFENPDGTATPRALVKATARRLLPYLQGLEVWEKTTVPSELTLRFGMPADGLQFRFLPLITIQRLEDGGLVRRFEISSTYAEGSSCVVTFRQRGGLLFYESEETCKNVW